MQLYEALAAKVVEWRKQNYPHDEYPAIGEILEWAHQPDVPIFRLRAPQLRALETYWYLRLVEKTAHIFDLYTRLFERTTERLDALGMTHPDMRELALDFSFNVLIDKVRDDDDFVKKYKLEALRETLTLAYPSYILALAMADSFILATARAHEAVLWTQDADYASIEGVKYIEKAGNK